MRMNLPKLALTTILSAAALSACAAELEVDQTNTEVAQETKATELSLYSATCNNDAIIAGPFYYPSWYTHELRYVDVDGPCKDKCIAWGESLGFSKDKTVYVAPLSQTVYEINYVPNGVGHRCALIK